jgi:hypothetical protein
MTFIVGDVISPVEIAGVHGEQASIRWKRFAPAAQQEASSETTPSSVVKGSKRTLSYPWRGPTRCQVGRNPCKSREPTRGFEPRIPSLRVWRPMPEDPCKWPDTAFAAGLEPAVNPRLQAMGRTSSRDRGKAPHRQIIFVSGERTLAQATGRPEIIAAHREHVTRIYSRSINQLERAIRVASWGVGERSPRSATRRLQSFPRAQVAS